MARVLWLGDPRALPVGGWSVEPGLAYSLTPEDLPDTSQVLTPAGPGPAALVGGRRAARRRPAARCTWAGCSRRRACATSSSSRPGPLDGRLAHAVGQRAAAAGPAGAICSSRTTCTSCPARSASRCTENDEAMPVTAQRGRAAARGARVVLPRRGRRGGLATGARPRCPGRRRPSAPCRPGTRLRRVRARRQLRADRRRPIGAAQPAFGWAAQYATTGRAAPRSPSRSSPTCPSPSWLEVAAWVVLAVALVGRRRRRPAATHR